MQEIIKRRLGKTDIEVTPIGLGAMEFAGGKSFFKYMFSPVEPETQDEIVKTALDTGMNLIDTAEIYGSGYSECAVARALPPAGQRRTTQTGTVRHRAGRQVRACYARGGRRQRAVRGLHPRT